jgi:hypothetical protein
MKTTPTTSRTFLLLALAALVTLGACSSTPKPGQRPKNAKQASKIFVLAGNWSPIDGQGSQLTFVPDVAGPSTGRVTGIFADGGTYEASEPQFETGRFSMWVNASSIDRDDPLNRTSITGLYSPDGKLLTLVRHFGGGIPDESKTYRR